jgi:multidrug resistance efflux pump
VDTQYPLAALLPDRVVHRLEQGNRQFLGTRFSPLPPHNATGNFTKIVQRLPVRIRLEPGQKDVCRLRVGMS